MERPLYRLDGDPLARRAPAGNAGLWFDKFCNQWRVEERSWSLGNAGEEDSPKHAWITSVTSQPVGTSHIDEFAMRLMRLIEARAGRAAVFVTESRFVTGLGGSHPVENGFAWHPTLGTPYLPGSSVKGLVRSWATLGADAPFDAESVARLLGDRQAAGTLHFLDALPVGTVQLEADVMTPHFPGWTEEAPPGDWLSPKPIPFLTTAAGTPFLFGILPCRDGGDGSIDDLKTASAWLRDALAWSGAGAKTSVGYGRFRHDDAETARWKERVRVQERERREERARQEAMRSPEGRWRLKLEALTEGGILDMVRVHLEKDPIADPSERAAFARAVVSVSKVGHWRRGTPHDPGTQVGRKKLRERARLLDQALGQGDVY